MLATWRRRSAQVSQVEVEVEVEGEGEGEVMMCCLSTAGCGGCLAVFCRGADDGDGVSVDSPHLLCFNNRPVGFS